MSISRLPKKKANNIETLRVTILMGGLSDERAVSLSTGKVVQSYLDRTKYKVRSVNMDKAGAWRKKINPKNTDIVFNALHGLGGEDGTVQGYFDVANIPYTGSGVLASALGMNKFISRQLFAAAGLDVPASILVNDKSFDLSEIELPVIIKPNKGGSSIGVKVIQTREDLARNIRRSLTESGPSLVEALIKGREVTVPVLGNANAQALPVVEITPRGSSFFDYRNKYKKDGALEEVPAKLSDTVTQQLQRVALQAHKTIGCAGYSRTDMFLLPDNRVKILEINTLPGLTTNSLLPKSAAAAGITFPALLDHIINYALERK